MSQLSASDAEPREHACAARPSADVHNLRHGYNLADLDLLARRAIWEPASAHLDYLTRYEEAWSCIAEYLYAAPTPPAPADLVSAARRHLAEYVRLEMHHHGVDRRDPRQLMGRYQAYWALQRSLGSPENGIVDRLALWQIWPLLTKGEREALLALAVYGTRQRAAKALGIPLTALQQRLNKGRRRFLASWHEGEAPSSFWGLDRRVTNTGDQVTTRTKSVTSTMRRRTGHPRRKSDGLIDPRKRDEHEQ